MGTSGLKPPACIICCIMLLLAMCLPAFSREGDAPFIAVFPLEDLRQSDETKGLGESIAAEITGGLARMADVRVVERRDLKKILDEIGLGMTGAIDEATAVRVGRLLGANRLVLGSFLKFNKKVRVNVRIVRTETGEILTTARVTGAFDDIFELEEELVCRKFRHTEEDIKN